MVVNTHIKRHNYNQYRFVTSYCYQLMLFHLELDYYIIRFLFVIINWEKYVTLAHWSMVSRIPPVDRCRPHCYIGWKVTGRQPLVAAQFRTRATSADRRFGSNREMSTVPRRWCSIRNGVWRLKSHGCETRTGARVFAYPTRSGWWLSAAARCTCVGVSW